MPETVTKKATKLHKIALSDNARTILENRYLQVGETPERRFKEVAWHVASAETDYRKRRYWYREFKNQLFSLKALPNSPTLANAGRVGAGCLSACFVRNPQDTMESILQCQHDWAMIEKWGGGVGADFSDVRPRGSKISTTHGVALGPIAVMRMFSNNAKEITQGSFRLGAHMGILSCLTSDTIISTLHGNFPIGLLVGERPYVYCANGNKIEIRQADKVFHSGKKKIIRVWLDDGGHIDCTPDHLFMLSDGSYREAGKLKQTDSLMAFYKRLSTDRDKPRFSIRMTDGIEEKQHRVVARMKYGRELGHEDTIDYINNDSTDDSPDNLQLLTREEHGRKTHQEDAPMPNMKGFIHSDKTKALWSNQRKGATAWNSGLTGDQYKNHYTGGFRNQYEEHGKVEKSCLECGNVFFVVWSRKEDRKYCSKGCQLKSWSKGNKEYVAPNHKVFFVEDLGIERDVYDITVPDFHNFVANGVFVHNCDHPDIQAFIHCLSGDTLIHTIDGQKPIKELVDTNPEVYCTNGTDVFVRKATRVWKTGTRKMIKILFFDGTVLRCTPEHLIMLRDGSYKPAGELQRNDRVMAFYKFIGVSGPIPKIGHTRKLRYFVGITGNSKKKQVANARVIGEYIAKRPLTLQDNVDHINNDSLNDALSNLQVLSVQEHGRKIYWEDSSLRFTNNQTNSIKKRRVESRSGYRHSPETKLKISLSNKGNIITPETISKRLATIEQRGGVISPRRLFDDAQIESIKKRVAAKESYSSIALELGCDPATISNIAKEKTYRELRSTVEVLPNHRVATIVEDAIEDVYDMEVPDFHNFVANGIFVHNCKDQDDTLQNFNISVRITDNFMRCVEQDKLWDLVDPHTKQVTKQIPARELWREICESAWKTGDPGVFFVERVWETQANPHLGLITSTNPCLLGATRMLTMNGLDRIDSIEYTQFYTTHGWQEGSAWKTGAKEVVNIVLSNGMSITTTPDHKFGIGETWVEAQDMEGEVQPFVGNASWEGEDTLNDTDYLKLGFVLGDGNRHESGAIYVNIGQNDEDMHPYFADGKVHGNKSHALYFGKDSNLVRTVKEFGMILYPLAIRNIPEKAFHLSPAAMRSFLKGLYTANGSVLDPKYRRVTLKGTSLRLLRDVQLMLLALGVRSYLTTNKPHIVEWPNGSYESKQSYDLNISGNDCVKFKEDIGFIQKYKVDRLEDIKLLEKTKRLTPTIIAIEAIGQAEVYDFSANIAHSGWANGFLVHNCGEQALPDGGSCNLASIDISKHVVNGEIDWSDLEHSIRVTTRFLDDVVTVNQFPLDLITEMNLKERRIGVGPMGWADALVKLNIPYDSEKGIKLAERVAKFMTDTAWDESTKLAAEKGEYPEYSVSRLSFKRAALGLPPVRNSDVTNSAPTGTISLLAGCSSGIEPYFALAWTRKALWKDHEGTSTLLYEAPNGVREALASRLNGKLESAIMRLAEHPYEKSSVLSEYGIDTSIFSTANDISPEWHVRMQAAWQKYITNSISKTINLANSASVEDIDEAYTLAWQTGCKAVTVYRDGSKSMQVLETGDTKKAKESIGVSISRNTAIEIAKNTMVKAEQERLDYVLGEDVTERATEYSRPSTLSGVTDKIETPSGTLYVTINYDNSGNIIEVFSWLGKGGGTNLAYLEAICRFISIGLQHGLSVDVVLKCISEIKSEPFWFNGTLIKSIPDAIAYVIKKHRKDKRADYTLTSTGSSLTVQSPVFDTKTVIQSTTQTTIISCPECSGQLVLEEGCSHCLSCGWSRCS